MTEWFEQWFGEEYLHLYPHRDDEDAANLTALISRHLSLDRCRTLDLACGPGRHTGHFRARGAEVVGFDLSMPLLSMAKHRNGAARPALVRGDMRRLPFRDGTFDLVVNLFTSFGYFAQDEQDAVVLQCAAAALRPGGWFVLDYLNASMVRASLVPHETTQVGERRVAVQRRITDDDRYVVKEIHLADQGRSFVERVRLFTPRDLERMLVAAGLVVQHRFGDYSGGDLTVSSPRAIHFAVRT
jgi:SAM-dependent methyltransferase